MSKARTSPQTTDHSTGKAEESKPAVVQARAAASPVGALAAFHRNPGALNAEGMLQLQNAAGNRAVAGLIRPLPPASGNRAVVQRVLRIDNSTASPFHALRYKQFQSLRKRSHGLTVDGWQWLRAMAVAGQTYRFAGWGEAIAAVKGLKWDPTQLARDTRTLSRPFDPSTSPIKFGEYKSAGPTMKDAHGFIQIVNYILQSYPVAQNVFVSPGASADPFAVALRIQGAQVVEIPLSGIKRDKLDDTTRPLALKYIRTCFGGQKIGQRHVVIFDAVISGDALVILKELIVEAFGLGAGNVKLVGLNNPGKPSAQHLKSTGELDVVPDTSHTRFVKSRIESQSYKLDIFKRIFPKYELSDLTKKSAGQLPERNREVEARMLSLVMAMRAVASTPFQEQESED